MRFFFAGLAIILAAVGVIVTTAGTDIQSSAPPPVQAWSNPDRPTPHDALASARWISDTNARTVWYFGVQAQADADAAAAAAALARRPRGGGGSGYHPGATVGECTGFAIPDYIIQRESGGNPSAKNPSSDAYGCAQTLLSHYSRGQCQGLEPTSIDGQRECVNRLSNGGTNLDPWAETR